jgi:DNA-directed RNA polymerase subunit E'/Rpb7
MEESEAIEKENPNIIEPQQDKIESQKMILKKPNQKKNRSKKMGNYINTIITRVVVLSINSIGKNIKQILEKVISTKYEGKCIVEGFIKPQSVKVLTYSSGLVQGSNIKFEVVFECLVCCPVEGMLIKCIVKNITKAGIRAETNEKISPIVVFIARDHHYLSNYFSNVKENDEIKIRVIGQRFELNDPYISIIAELIEPKEEKKKGKPRLILKD